MGLFSKYFENMKAAPEAEEELEKKNTAQLYWYVLKTFFWKMILLNLLCILTCIPVITIPASFAAVSRICMKWLMGQHVELKDDYFKEFRISFWKSWVYVLIAAIMTGMLILACFAYYTLLNGTAMTIIMVLCVVWYLWIFTVLCYSFSMQAITDLSVGSILKNSILISVTAFPSTLLLAILPGVVYFLCVLFFPLTLPLILIIAVSFTQLGVCTISLKPIKKYILSI